MLKPEIIMWVCALYEMGSLEKPFHRTVTDV